MLKHAFSFVTSLALVLLANGYLSNTEMKMKEEYNASVPCSWILVEDRKNTAATNGEAFHLALDECTCKLKNSMLCPKLSSKPFKFNYKGYSKELTLSGELILKDFDTVAQHIAPFLNDIDTYSFSLARCCDAGIDYGTRPYHFDSTSDNSLSVFNVSRFHGIYSVRKLDLNSNCFGSIVNNFRNSFPNLIELDMSSNALKTIPDHTFEGLEQLEMLKLDLNRIETITRFTFVGLTSLTALSLFFNRLKFITDDVFRELPNLEELRFGNNKITTISPSAFSQNVQLTHLSLSTNLLEDIPPTAFSTLIKLTTLSIEECRLQSLPESLFKGLKRLQNISLYSNNISYIHRDTFVTNRMLRDVQLSGNQIKELPQLSLGFLRLDGPASFRLANNNMTNLVTPLVTRIKVAKLLDLSRNCFSNVTEVQPSTRDMATTQIMELMCDECCLSAVPNRLLENVVISGSFRLNYIESVSMGLLSSVAHLDSLDLSHNFIATVHLLWTYPLVQDKTKKPCDNPATKVILRNNPIFCDCKILLLLQIVANKAMPPVGVKRSLVSFDITDVFCRDPEDLREVRISQILQDKNLSSKLMCKFTSGCPEQCTCHLLAVDDVVNISCINKGILYFPTFPESDKQFIVHLENNEIQNLPEKNSPVWKMIRELYMDNNRLSTLDNLTFTPAFRVLSLRNNKIKQFHPSLKSFLNSNNKVSLSLSSNPWECSCELYNHMKTLFYNQEHVKDFKQVFCIWPDSKMKVFLANATIVDLCPELLYTEPLLKALLSSFAIIVVISSIATTVICRYKAEIQLWMFTRGYCLKLVTEEDLDSEKRYDAFISYSTKDEEWVATHLVSTLENGRPAYSLCLHNRDWPVGEWIPDQILRSVHQSRRTIIVLTDNFIESDWSRLEFRAAYRQALSDKVNRVLVVVPGDSLPDLKMLDSDLRNFIRLNIYIKWTDHYFWRKLRCAMPRSKTSLRRRQHPKLDKISNNRSNMKEVLSA